MTPLTAIILAAGEAKRMRSSRPKVLHRLCGRPLIDYPVARLSRPREPAWFWWSAARPTTCAPRSAMRPTLALRRAEGAARHRPRGAAGAGGLRGCRRHAPGPSRRHAAASGGDARAPGRHHQADRRGVHHPHRDPGRPDGLRPRRARRSGPADGDRRAPGRDAGPARDPRDRHQRLLLRRAAVLARARAGHAPERAGRVLPDRRDRHPRTRGPPARGGVADDPSGWLGINDRKQLAAVAAILRAPHPRPAHGRGRDRDRPADHLRGRHRAGRRRHRALPGRDPRGPDGDRAPSAWSAPAAT